MSVKLFRKQDFVYIGPSESDLINEFKETAEANNLPYTLYERDAFLAKYPQFFLRKNEVAIVDHTSGLVYPEENVKAFLSHAEKHGATILENARVMSWTELKDCVRIALFDGTIVEAD